jgi:hypothetical protein
MIFVKRLPNKEEKIKGMIHEFCIRGGDNTCRILSHFSEDRLKLLLSEIID